MNWLRLLSFNHCSRATPHQVLIIPQAHETGMPQVAVRCPFGEFDLSDQRRMKLAAVLHFFFTQCSLRALFLRQIREGTDIRLQFSEPFENLTPYARNKAISDFGGIHKSRAFIVILRSARPADSPAYIHRSRIPARDSPCT